MRFIVSCWIILAASAFGQTTVPQSLCDGTDHGAAIEALILKAGPNAWLMFPTGICATSRTLTYLSGQRWSGPVSAFQDLAGPTTIESLGASPLIEPANLSSNLVNVVLENLIMAGGAYANPVVYWHGTSYGAISKSAVLSSVPGGNGIVLDASGGLQCYFNELRQLKVDGLSGQGIVFQNGANGNQMFGGKVGNGSNGAVGLVLTSSSAANQFYGVDFEDNVGGTHVLVDSPENVFYGNHMENALTGFSLTPRAYLTRIDGTSYASTVTNKLVCASQGCAYSMIIDIDQTSASGTMSIGPVFRTFSDHSTGATVNDDFNLEGPAANVILNVGLNTKTSGIRQVNWYKMDGTNSLAAQLDLASGNLWIAGTVIS